MRSFVGLLALISGVSVEAQSFDAAAYFPLTTGNVWVYYHSVDPAQVSNYVRWEVVGDTTLEGQQHALVETVMLDHFYVQKSTGLCAIRIELAGDTFRSSGRLLKGEGACPDTFPNEALVIRQGRQPRWVVDERRRINAILVSEEGEGNGSQGMLAEGVGFLSWVRWPTTENDSLRWESYSLQSARIDGRTLGEEPMRTERPEWTRFYPLELGDEWLYGHVIRMPSRNMAVEFPPDTWIRRIVVGDTMLHDTSYRLVKERRYTSDHILIEEALCGVRREERMGWFEWISVEGFCAPQEGTFPFTSWGAPLTDPTRVERQCHLRIGQDSSVFDACFHLWIEPYDPTTFVIDVRFGLDLGLIQWITLDGQRMEGLKLWYASVGGRTYGVDVLGDPTDELPRELALENAYPNPFTETTTLTYALPTAGTFRLELFDVRGRRVLHIDLEDRAAGRAAYQLDGTDLAAGLYVVRLMAPDGDSITRRIVRLR